MFKKVSVQKYVDNILEHCMDTGVGLVEGSKEKEEYEKEYRPITNKEADYLFFACWMYDKGIDFEKEVAKNNLFFNSRQSRYDILQKYYLQYMLEEYVDKHK